jgi:hypothetical protein
LLSEEAANKVEARLRDQLKLDSHGEPRLGGAYRTTSLYTDTSGFDVFRGIGEYANTKFRIRQYGSTGPVFLERKDKAGDKVHKTRIQVPELDLRVLDSNQEYRTWAGQWFHDEISRRRLKPVCRISYERIAYLGSADNGPVRVTFDRKVRGEPARAWQVAAVTVDEELLAGSVICEFKYRLAMPRMFKELMESLGLHSRPCSKYRRFIAAAGLALSGNTRPSGAADHV